MRSTLNVTELIDNSKISSFQIRVVVLCVLLMSLDGYDAQSMSFAAPAVVAAWHVAKSSFGPVFTAAFAGLATGGLLFGMLADYFGRKPMLIACTCIFSVFTIAKPLTTSMTVLLFLQFFAALGCGGVFPNAVALSAEYSPKRNRATMVSLAVCGYSVGSGLGGFFAAFLLTRFGWKSIFFVGGIGALVLAFIMLFALPESVSILVVKKKSAERIASILRKIAPNTAIASDASFVVHENKGRGVPVIELFRQGRASRTILLWFAACMDLAVIVFMLSWLPMLAQSSGLKLGHAVLTGAMFSLAGIFGGIVVGRGMDWFGVHRALALSFFIGALFIGLIGFAAGSFSWLMATVFCVGFFVIGGHVGINAFTSELYPTYIRSTGVGWALGVGRFGSLISPTMGGLFLAWHWHLTSIFYAVAIPAFLAAATIYVIGTLTAHAPVASEAEAEKATAGA